MAWVPQRPKLAAAFVALAALLPALLMTGCATPASPGPISIASDQYSQAFDAAIEAARREGLVGGLRDRRGGTVETEPDFAPTLLEPWYTAREPLARTIESTIAFQRRRARFEFVPARLDVQAESSEQGPDLLAVRHSAPDLTAYDGDLELRIMVHVERSYTPGQRRSTWARRATTRMLIIDDERTLPRSWTPIGRDSAMEQRLVSAIQAALARQ